MKGETRASAIVKTLIYIIILIFILSLLFKFWELIGFLKQLQGFGDWILKGIFG